MKSPPMHESSNTEPDVDETLNIGTKSSPSKTKKIIQDDVRVPPTISQDKNKSIENPNSEIQQVVQT